MLLLSSFFLIVVLVSRRESVPWKRNSLFQLNGLSKLYSGTGTINSELDGKVSVGAIFICFVFDYLALRSVPRLPQVTLFIGVLHFVLEMLSLSNFICKILSNIYRNRTIKIWGFEGINFGSFFSKFKL